MSKDITIGQYKISILNPDYSIMSKDITLDKCQLDTPDPDNFSKTKCRRFLDTVLS